MLLTAVCRRVSISRAQYTKQKGTYSEQVAHETLYKHRETQVSREVKAVDISAQERPEYQRLHLGWCFGGTLDNALGLGRNV